MDYYGILSFYFQKFIQKHRNNNLIAHFFYKIENKTQYPIFDNSYI